MKQTAADHAVPLTGTDATLSRQDFVDTSNGHELRTYTLQWEPVTKPIKDQYLGYDNEAGITFKRLPINNSLRSSPPLHNLNPHLNLNRFFFATAERGLGLR